MQARADPDACGEKEDVFHFGNKRGGSDSEMYVLRRSPLYGAVQRAKGCGKKRGREIVHLLLRHGFRKFPDGGVSPRVCAVLCCPVCVCAVMCVGNFPICLFCFWLRLKEWIRRMCV